MEEEEAGGIRVLMDLHLQELGVPAVVLEMLIRLTLEVLELLDKVLMEEVLYFQHLHKALEVAALAKQDYRMMGL
jgi:hypothetical protein